ncbi:hypothetical protein IWW50_006458 [Coemansia erecta]|nr:hypothetical protein IWW50_006458 [Coemansia erecta]
MDGLVKNKILVLGRPEINKVELVRSIIAAGSGGQAEDTQAEDTQAENTQADEESAKIAWQVETRYYRASVEFWVDSTEQLPAPHTTYMDAWLARPAHHPSDENSTDDDPAVPLEPGVKELQAQLGDVVDAVIFVFDPSRPETFADILPWARFARQYGPSVLLCVAQGAGASSDECKDRWFGWCVGGGWEWVDLTDPDPECGYSVARVRDALVANEWAHMVPTGCSARSAETDSGDVAGPQDARGREEWGRFEQVAVDPRRVDELGRAMFAAGAGQDDVAGLLDQLRGMRDEISRMDPEQARTKAAELAMALAKHG